MGILWGFFGGSWISFLGFLDCALGFLLCGFLCVVVLLFFVCLFLLFCCFVVRCILNYYFVDAFAQSTKQYYNAV